MVPAETIPAGDRPQWGQSPHTSAGRPLTLVRQVHSGRWRGAPACAPVALGQTLVRVLRCAPSRVLCRALASGNNERPTLRAYQEADVTWLEEAIAARTNTIYVLPTGGGKTVTFAELTRRLEAKGKRTLIIVHRLEIMQQTKATLEKFGVFPTVVAAGQKGRTHGDGGSDALTTLAMVQTLSRRGPRDFAGSIDCIIIDIIDEAHHAVADSYMKLFESNQGAVLLGITATPFRLDGSGLGKANLAQIIEGPIVGELVAQGHLVPFVYREAKLINTDGVALSKAKSGSGGDYMPKQGQVWKSANTIVDRPPTCSIKMSTTEFVARRARFETVREWRSISVTLAPAKQHGPHIISWEDVGQTFRATFTADEQLNLPLTCQPLTVLVSNHAAKPSHSSMDGSAPTFNFALFEKRFAKLVCNRGSEEWLVSLVRLLAQPDDALMRDHFEHLRRMQTARQYDKGYVYYRLKDRWGAEAVKKSGYDYDDWSYDADQWSWDADYQIASNLGDVWESGDGDAHLRHRFRSRLKVQRERGLKPGWVWHKLVEEFGEERIKLAGYDFSTWRDREEDLGAGASSRHAQHTFSRSPFLPFKSKPVAPVIRVDELPAQWRTSSTGARQKHKELPS